MLSKKDEDALKALEASLKSDEIFSRNSTKLLTRLDKRTDKAVGIKRGFACIAAGVGLLLLSVFLDIFIFAVAAGLAVTAGFYLAVPWKKIVAWFSLKVEKYEKDFYALLEKKTRKKKSAR